MKRSNFKFSGAFKEAVLGACCGFTILAGSVVFADSRVFTDVDGRSLQAEFISYQDDKVTLKLSNGKTSQVPFERFSADDQEFIKAQGSKADELVEKLNQACGHEAFEGQSEWTSRDAAVLAEKLKLPQESSSPVGDSWRLYAAFRAPNYRLFGAMPYSAALYSDAEGKVSSLSAVFANKGDYGSKVGFGQNHMKKSSDEKPASSLQEAMERDYEKIKIALTEVLGEPEQQRFGDTAMRRTVDRWDWNGHSFILSNVPDEYVGLEIISTEQAELGGRAQRVASADAKKRLDKSVKRNDRGDVWIDTIPMVDQGPKGYCGPATFERAMRHVDVDADMYLLAMVGQSRAGGGTILPVLVDSIKSQVYNKGRRIRQMELRDIKVRGLKRYIDNGIPLLWQMTSTDSYNKVADANTKARTEAPDAYLEAMVKVREKFADMPKAHSHYHLCMIIGYNEETQEVAVSDSWGESYAVRWVPVEVANWAHRENVVVIQP